MSLVRCLLIKLDAAGQGDALELLLLRSSDAISPDVELDQRLVILWIVVNNRMHADGAKTTAIAHLVTLMASATIFAPSALRLFAERFSDVNALLLEDIRDIRDISV
jgi:hypothetical protein